MRVMTSPHEAPDVRQMTSGPDDSFDPTWDPDRQNFLFSRRSATPGSPVRVHKLWYATKEVTLVPGQHHPTADYAQPEWAVKIEGGATITRSLSLTLRKHLKAVGQISVGAGNSGCAANVPVLVQKKKATQWVTAKSTTTGAAVSPGVANYKVGIPDKTGTYRVSLEKAQILGGDNCAQALSPSKKHSH